MNNFFKIFFPSIPKNRLFARSFFSWGLRVVFSIGIFSLSAHFSVFAKLKVVGSIPPYSDLAKIIGGEKVEVVNFAPMNSDPHTFEPKPSQLKEIMQADLYIACDLPFETAFLPKMKALNPKLKVVHLNSNFPLLPGDEEEHEQPSTLKKTLAWKKDGEKTGSWDTHTWLSPILGKLQAAILLQAFTEQDPVSQIVYQERYHQFIDQADALYFSLQKKIQPFLGETIFAYHGIEAYFAQAFGLNFKSLEVEGKEVTPQKMGQLLKDLKKSKKKVLFYSDLSHEEKAKELARLAGAKIYFVNHYGLTWQASISDLASSLLKAWSE